MPEEQAPLLGAGSSTAPYGSVGTFSDVSPVNAQGADEGLEMQRLESRKKGKKKKNKGDDSDDEDVAYDPEDAAMRALAKSKYDMKNHMANERTFFKYLFTGLHVGGVGTLVLSFFSRDDGFKLALVITIWLIAFGFMFWGLYSYYHRKHLMESGHFKDSQMLNPHTPAIISSIFLFVIVLVLAYAVYANGQVSKLSTWHSLFSARRDAPAVAVDAKHAAAGGAKVAHAGSKL